LSADVSLKILQKSLGSTVLVRLRNGKVLRGLLKGYDQHMNIVLEDTDELVGENTQNRRITPANIYAPYNLETIVPASQ
jgi:small nuclear ribonucleoprotein